MLGIPNYEVRKALYKIVLPALTMQSNAQVITTQNMLLYSLNICNLHESMKCLKALIADVPYSNKKLASMDMEERYRLIMSTIFNAIGCRVEVEKMIATGRIDMVVQTTNYIYVLELSVKSTLLSYVLGGGSRHLRRDFILFAEEIQHICVQRHNFLIK